ncbi:hypothetical protein ACFODL_01695 [Phenylobacterium terrae]|uniref:DUF1648 domain-containing protein n=1 Tax=Phenylobacterium terrae TaxID=2665495 RepID=A0ABW4MZE0_9CAUL
MNRIVRLLLVAIVVELALVAAGALAWRAHAGQLAADLQRPLRPLVLLAIPVSAATLLILAHRLFAAERMRLAEDHARHLQGALVFWFVFLAAVQAWAARLYLNAEPPALDGASYLRLVCVLVGVAMAIRGNFFAKLSPPTGADAPAPAVWTRTALRIGWGLTLTGAVLAASGLLLPPRPLFLVFLGSAPILIGLSLYQRRALRRREAQP